MKVTSYIYEQIMSHMLMSNFTYTNESYIQCQPLALIIGLIPSV